MNTFPSSPSPPPRVAIIGSGIGGLTAAYLLGQHGAVEVTMFEAESTIGMGAHAVNVEVEGTHHVVDVPLRVYSEKYYPFLTRLYREAGIESKLEDYSGSFSIWGETVLIPFFAYKNLLVGNVSLPYISLYHFFSRKFWSIVLQYFYFHYQAPTDLSTDQVKNLTIQEYLTREKYSFAFINYFFIPTICAICTCSYEAARNYPADLIVEYLTKRFLYGVRRAQGGTKEITKRLSSCCKKIYLNTRVASVAYSEATDRVIVSFGDTSESFSHVIMATQANQALKIIQKPTALQEKILNSVAHERSTVIVHSDSNLMPASEYWQSVNFIMPNSEADCAQVVPLQGFPMASIWLNRVGLLPPDAPNYFQTWAPLKQLKLDPLKIVVYFWSTF